MRTGTVLSCLMCWSFVNFANAATPAADYICSKEKKPTESWFVSMRSNDDPLGALHADVRDGDNKKVYVLFCENQPYYNNYTCHNSGSDAYSGGFAIFYPAPHYHQPSLEIRFSNADESTTTTHYYKCERNLGVCGKPQTEKAESGNTAKGR
jgi:hypothetical protein